MKRLIYNKWFDNGNWWIPLSTTRFGWSVKSRSIHEGDFGKLWAGSGIIWCKPYVEVKDSIWTPSLVLMPWVHHVFDFTLKFQLVLTI